MGKDLFVRMIVLATSLMLGACSANMLPFSSGALEGDEVAPVADWTEIASVEVVQLESRPADPYSVNLWVLGDGAKLYVFAGGTKANWIEHIEVDPNVRLKMGEVIYPLRAQRVTDPEEFEVFAEGWKEKYGRRPWNDDVTDTYLMRLLPRDG